MKSLLLAVGMSVPNERQHRSSVDAGALRKNDNDDIYIYRANFHVLLAFSRE